jgi:hypothetical protein
MFLHHHILSSGGDALWLTCNKNHALWLTCNKNQQHQSQGHATSSGVDSPHGGWFSFITLLLHETCDT